jgi:aquaporin Z
MSDKKTFAARVACEVFGTFVLISAIIYSNGEPAVVAAALLVAVALTGKISGGHLNPIVTMVAAVKGDLAPSSVLPFLASQVIGGLLAFLTSFIVSAVVKNLNAAP